MNDALDDEQRQAAAFARGDDPRHVAQRSRRARVEHVQRLRLSGVDRRPELAEVRRRCVVVRHGQAEIAGAVDVWGIGRRNLELRRLPAGPSRLTFQPTLMCRTGAAGELLQHVQLFERRVGGREEAESLRLRDRLNRPLHRRDADAARATRRAS